MSRALLTGLLLAAFAAGLFPSELMAAGEAVVSHVHQTFLIRFIDAGAFGFACL